MQRVVFSDYFLEFYYPEVDTAEQSNTGKWGREREKTEDKGDAQTTCEKDEKERVSNTGVRLSVQLQIRLRARLHATIALA